ncbi:MAG: hypothetical protein R3Y50_08810 [Rikenellaceae bacterium]
MENLPKPSAEAIAKAIGIQIKPNQLTEIVTELRDKIGSQPYGIDDTKVYAEYEIDGYTLYINADTDREDKIINSATYYSPADIELKDTITILSVEAQDSDYNEVQVFGLEPYDKFTIVE